MNMDIFWNYYNLSEDEQIKLNKELINEYPFLMPKNYMGEISPSYDYTWTLLDEVPIGWRISLIPIFLEELKAELIRCNYLDKYSIAQIKEKYGELRWYSNGVPTESNEDDIVEKYSVLSENICIGCGKPDVPMINASWVSPYCEDCWVNIYSRNELNGEIKEKVLNTYNKLKNKDNKMSNIYEYTKYNNGKKELISIDITETANKIRENWETYLNYKKK